MPLTCYCDYDDGDYDWYYDGVNDYAPLVTTRAKRCSSCGAPIPVGALACKITRWRHPRSEVELRIHHFDETAEIPLAAHYMCEGCSDLYWSLYELGFECVSPEEDMRELVRQYSQEYSASP